MTVQATGVLLDIEGGVATLTLNDAARRNAMTPELGDALRARVEELRRRDDVRAVVLAGAGGTFSAGGDLQMLERLRQVSFEEARGFMLDFYSRYLSILDLPVPTVAAVEGAAIGAGLCVALACDVCIVSEDAKLALNFVQLGLHPGMGATYLVPMRAGPQRAAELLLTGRRFDGREAVRLGLALEATAATETRTRASALATNIAANAPLATRGLKQRLGLDRAGLQRALEEEARLQAESYGSADLGEGLAAAAARRPPVFQGR
ncbi:MULTISPECIES: enoyl-CoA hydratase/isomerase family protein [Myxococcus]|uniref:enoyl-CoA hydratase/isomerase family protein n=1 Tax=Myxococcus TaxID=32 RepID=UPI0013D1F583|nr:MULTISPECIES: enoyl-CoA hydratase/isomerase family protein [Myxococcus]NVJ23868.1 enoyl-CoA hydratase/isomerase family protein [Myxococcus sp. AM011]